MNTLELFDLIRKQAARDGSADSLVERLVALAQDFGIEEVTITNALYSRRNLVIYEP